VYNSKFKLDKICLIIYENKRLTLITLRQATNRILKELKSNSEIIQENINCNVNIEIIRDIEAKKIFISHSISNIFYNVLIY
jgi:hypothetical protein